MIFIAQELKTFQRFYDICECVSVSHLCEFLIQKFKIIKFLKKSQKVQKIISLKNYSNDFFLLALNHSVNNTLAFKLFIFHKCRYLVSNCFWARTTAVTASSSRC